MRRWCWTGGGQCTMRIPFHTARSPGLLDFLFPSSRTYQPPSSGHPLHRRLLLRFVVMGQWIALISKGFKGGSKGATYTSSTMPKMKPYAPTAAGDYGYVNNQYQQRHGKSSKSGKGDFIPIYVAVGMIAMSTGLGLHTAWQQLRNSPTVRVKKQRRETLPEVVDPDHVVEETDKYIKKSFFRKVAHVQDQSYPDKSIIPDPIRKEAYAYQPRVETLKSVGVDPVTLNHA